MRRPPDKGIAPTQKPTTTCAGTRPNTGVHAVGRKNVAARWQREIGGSDLTEHTRKGSCLELTLGGHQGQPQAEAKPGTQHTLVSCSLQTMRRTSSQ